jgi:hypothetical protein
MGFILGPGCKHGGGPIPCGGKTCDGSSEFCETSTVEAENPSDNVSCAPLPSDYDPTTCDGLCGDGDSTIDCKCDDNGCSVTCQAP